MMPAFPTPGAARLASVLFPDPPRRLPHERWIAIAFRTAHLIAAGSLLGGHLFAVPPDRLYSWLVATVASGLGLIALEVYRSAHWFHMAQGVLVLLKALVTALAGLWWSERVPLLLLVAVLGSVGSHMAGRYRHYSILYRRDMAA